MGLEDQIRSEDQRINMADDVMNGVSHDAVYRTFSQSCKTLFPNITHLDKVQDAVFRMNKIKILAGELLTIHIHRCLENDLPLPILNQNWCNQLYNKVSYVNSENSEKEDSNPELTETLNMLEGPFDKPSRHLIIQILTSEAIDLQASIVTNITRHYKKRVLRFVRLTFYKEKLPSDEYKKLKLEMMQVAEDICRNSTKDLISPLSYHDWIEEQRNLFGLSSLLEETNYEKAMKDSSQLFLPSMHFINRTLEDNGKRTFSLLPLRRKFRPGFIKIDTDAFKTLLSLKPMASRKETLNNCLRKRKLEEAAGTYVNPRSEEGKRIKLENKNEIQETRNKEKEKYDAFFKSLTKEEQKKERKIQKEKNDERKRVNRVNKYEKKDKGREEKDSFFNNFMDIRVNPPKGYVFNHSIRTDGVSVRLCYTRIVRKRTDNDPKMKNGKPKRGLYTIDQLKYYSRLTLENMQVIGIDPGMHDLIHAITYDEMLQTSKTLKYTSVQRRYETCSTFYLKKMRNEKPLNVLKAEQELSEHNSRSSHVQRLQKYFLLRRCHMHDFCDFYGDLIYRKRRWRTFKNDQRSISKLVNNLRMMKTRGKTLVLAYGSWANVSSTFNPKGIAPCKGIGLRRRLSKEFIVADTPEHYTSKTCHRCLSECGPFYELDNQRRQKHLEKAVTPEEKKKASRYSVRSIRRCKNVECGVILNRDKNAAQCIEFNLKRLFLGQPPLRKLTEMELQMEKLHCSICLSD